MVVMRMQLLIGRHNTTQYKYTSSFFLRVAMRFKNLFVYQLDAKWKMGARGLESVLAARALQPCGSLEMESRGWTPIEPDGPFLYVQHGHWLLALAVERKILPAGVIRQVTADRAAVLAKKQAHSIGRKQMREIRERVVDELLPRALVRRQITRAWIDPAKRLLMVDTASQTRAEQVLETLHKSGADFPAKQIDTELAPSSAMTGWLAQGRISSGFTIDRDLELRSGDENKATVRYVRHTLEGKDIRAHIAAGKSATRLGMTWKDKISFVLTESLQIKRINFLDILDQAADQNSENEEEQLALDIVLMTGELSLLIADLITLLGGEKATKNA
jgi:recombination associated protein RdgC